MSRQYPFAAIVGQHQLRKALLLCAINPSIGGLLIKGEKGTAKSTAARGLAGIMPQLHRVRGSVYNLSELDHQNYPGLETVDHTDLEEMPVPFVDLPLGASQDRVIGSLDLEAIVSEKKKRLLPGLLAGAHRGVLYIDEVNLLPDHLVDILLDVAAMGSNTVQREGLSIKHPSRFILIGTMNPEEGNLRPQFLDRFGLMVEVEAQSDVSERTEVVKRRMSFEKDREVFNDLWDLYQRDLREQILEARQILPSVIMPEGLLTMVSQLCIEWSVASLRADIVMYKTAVTIAALAKRKTVSADDIREAAALVLVHRKGKKAFNQKQNSDSAQSDPPAKAEKRAGDGIDRTDGETTEGLSGENDQTECGDGNCGAQPDGSIFLPGEAPLMPQIKTEKIVFIPETIQGRRTRSSNTPDGFQIRTGTNATENGIAISETIRHAMIRDPESFQIKKEDVHHKVLNGKSGHLILFVVDASGSMAAGKRMEAVKASVLGLLEDAYQKRDTVGMIAFRGVEAELLLAPTRSTELAEKALEILPTGGRTPLAHALALASDIINEQSASNNPLLIILSDGKANVPLPGGGDPWAQAMEIAAKIGDGQVRSLVLDTESGYVRLGRAAELARTMKGEYISLDDLSAESIMATVNFRLND